MLDHRGTHVDWWCQPVRGLGLAV